MSQPAENARGKLHEPSDAQWEAIRCVDDHLLIDAGAGTGKTATVVLKTLYLMGVEMRETAHETPLQLRDIAAITYTNKAAAELKDKLRSALRTVGRRRDAYQVDSARVGTIHSFCGDILREFALRRGRSPGLTLLDDAASAVLRGEVVRESLLAALEQGSIDGLTDLLSVWSVKDIEGWVSGLLEQGDHLRVLAANYSAPNSAEAVLMALAQEAQALLLARLDEAGQMDFDRMVVWTRDLIRDDATVRKLLQRRIRVLVIDEFQDVDPVQREIAYLLADPERRRTDTTRLVLVGDAKQSIYRFRRSDVSLWRSVERDFRNFGTGRVVQLAESRRSVSPVLGFVDSMIGPLLDTPVDAVQGVQDFEVPYTPLIPLRTDGVADRAVEFITIPADDGGKVYNAEIVRLSEARAIAERIRELHDVQNIPWRDIAVLLCGWGSVDIYAQALQDAAIPTYTLRAEGFYECREVLDVIVALEAIRLPSNDRMLLGFLRSPFVGLTDESLLWIARQIGMPAWKCLGDVVLPVASEQALLQHGITLLKKLGSLCDRISVAELIDCLLTDTGYIAHLELLGDIGRDSAKQRIANVHKLVQMASASLDATVSDFLQTIERQRELQVKEGEARLYGESDDVVTITSVHSAKGLEWRCVFWSDLVRGTRDDYNKLLIGGRSIALGEPDTSPKDQSDTWKAVRAGIDAERDAETKRLWYVAATRARDLLVLSGIPLGTGGRHSQSSPAVALKARFPALEENVAELEYVGHDGRAYTALVRSATALTGDHTPNVVSAQVERNNEARLTPPQSSVHVAGRRRHSATELMVFDRCERRHWFKYVAGLQEPSLPLRGSGQEINAINAGLIIHDVLEHSSTEAPTEDLLDAAIGRWDPNAPLPEDRRGQHYRAMLMQQVEGALGRPEYRAVSDKVDARRELAFMHIDSAGDCFEGQIDLIAPSESNGVGYDIVDVKTVQCDTEAVVRKTEAYGLQRALYTRAVEEITGSEVNSFAFDFTAPGIHQRDIVTEETRRDGELRLTGAVTKLKLDRRLVTPHNTECQFCGYRNAGWCEGASQD